MIAMPHITSRIDRSQHVRADHTLHFAIASANFGARRLMQNHRAAQVAAASASRISFVVKFR
jgi:hypothetical protein